jgi:hypothetical protein
VPAIQSYFIEPIFEQFCALLPEREVNHPLVLQCHFDLVAVHGIIAPRASTIRGQSPSLHHLRYRP